MISADILKRLESEAARVKKYVLPRYSNPTGKLAESIIRTALVDMDKAITEDDGVKAMRVLATLSAWI